jgi:hypothetical protein
MKHGDFGRGDVLGSKGIDEGDMQQDCFVRLEKMWMT